MRPLVNWADPETKPRSRHAFKASWQSTLDLLGRETIHLGAKLVVIQVDVTEGEIRLDGMLRAGAKVGHPGAIVSFSSKFGPLRYAADTYLGDHRMPAWQANIRAIALSLEALRSVDRWGASKRGEQYRGWTAIEAPKATFADRQAAAAWMREYAIKQLNILTDTGSDLKSLYRAMARRMHPDQGAPRADWDRLDEARRVLTEAGMM